MQDELDYGPLKELIGTWHGDRGMDIAPEPDGAEENPYFYFVTLCLACAELCGYH